MRARGQRILLVSACEPLRQVMSLHLHAFGGYEVLACRSLREAQLLPAAFAVQLILLHATRGYRTEIGALKEFGVRAGVPLLCLTNDARPLKVMELLAAGARQVLLEPVEPVRLLAFVRALVAD